MKKVVSCGGKARDFGSCQGVGSEPTGIFLEGWGWVVGGGLLRWELARWRVWWCGPFAGLEQSDGVEGEADVLGVTLDITEGGVR